MMKTGKEVKTNGFKDYNVVFGSVNNKHPKAIYINISAWVQPKEDECANYSRVIRNINKQVKQKLFNLFEFDEQYFAKERSIVDLDIRESGIRFGKRSFMSCEITLFLEQELSVNTDTVKDRLSNIIQYIIKDVFEQDENFSFHRTKK